MDPFTASGASIPSRELRRKLIGNIYGSSQLPEVRSAPDKQSARRIRLWARRASRKLRLPGLPFIVKFSFSETLPYTVIGRTGLRGLVKINRREWQNLSTRNQRRLIVHELCHVAEIIQYASISGHGALFARIMRRAGVKPNGIDLAGRET